MAEKTLMVSQGHGDDTSSIYITNLNNDQLKYLTKFIDKTFDDCSWCVNIKADRFDEDYEDVWEEGYADSVREALSQPIMFNESKMAKLQKLKFSETGESEMFCEFTDCLTYENEQ